MTTLGTMITRVVDELHEADLTDEAEAAIRSAIIHYENERFWKTENSAVTTTVAGQETYPLPDDAQQLDSLTVIVSNDEYPLIRRSWEWMVEKRRNAATFQGYPKDFCTYRNQIYLYPTPNDAFTMTAYFVCAPTSLTGTGDSNVFTTTFEELIRTRAKWDVAHNVMHDFELADRLERHVESFHDKVLEKTTLQSTTGRLRPRHF